MQLSHNTNTNIEKYKYKYCHQTDWEFVWWQESLKINGVDSVCSEKNAQQLHFMQTTPGTTAVKISEKLQPMQFLKLSCPRYFCSIITWKWKLENSQLCVIVRRTIISSNSRLWDVMITFNIENIGKRSSDSPFLENNQLIKTMFVSVLDTALWRKYSQ